MLNRTQVQSASVNYPCNPVERLSAFVVVFSMRSLVNPRGATYLPVIPVVFLGREDQPTKQEILRGGREGLKADWYGDEYGKMSDWEVVDSQIVPVVQEWVVNSGPANKTEYVPSAN